MYLKLYLGSCTWLFIFNRKLYYDPADNSLDVLQVLFAIHWITGSFLCPPAECSSFWSEFIIDNGNIFRFTSQYELGSLEKSFSLPVLKITDLWEPAQMHFELPMDSPYWCRGLWINISGTLRLDLVSYRSPSGGNGPSFETIDLYFDVCRLKLPSASANFKESCSTIVVKLLSQKTKCFDLLISPCLISPIYVLSASHLDKLPASD